MRPLRLFLCGDVMTGRGIDQVMQHPSSPELHEPYVMDARDYVQLAERANGPIRIPVSFDYIWGEALKEIRRNADVRIANLETSITTSEDFWPGKGINYRMHPQNISCLAAAHIDCCCLANNHVMDWGYAGLDETMRVLDAAGIHHAGAGRDFDEASAPAVIDMAGKGRVLIFSFGSVTSGIPLEWGAAANRSGINLLEDFSESAASRVAAQMHRDAGAGDVLVASIHWGSNWGYQMPEAHVQFAHRLVEEGIAIVHGHSSHHLRPIEICNDGLILYGCGDFINDYEGIAGYATFRDDLRMMFFVSFDPERGRLMEIRLVPMQMRNFRLIRATTADVCEICTLVNQLGAEARLEAGSIVLKCSC